MFREGEPFNKLKTVVFLILKKSNYARYGWFQGSG